MICEHCNGTGNIETTEDKIRKILSNMYESITIRKNDFFIGYDHTYEIHLSKKTSHNGSDIIGYKEALELNKLGFGLACVNPKYIWLREI